MHAYKPIYPVNTRIPIAIRSTFPTGNNSNLESNRYGPLIGRDVTPSATSSVSTLRVTSLQQVECIHYGPFAPNSLLSAVPFADAVSRKPCLKVSRLTAPTKIRIFDNSTPSSSFTSMIKGLLTLRLEDCASSHLKLAASRCSLSYATSTASCLRSRKSACTKDFLNSSHRNEE